MIREITVELDGKSYEVKVDFSLIEKIERRVDLMDYAISVQREKIKMTDTAWVLFCALKGENFTHETIGEMVMDSPVECHTIAVEIVLQAMTPKSKKKDGEKKKGKEEKQE